MFVHTIHNDSPFSIDISCTFRHGINNLWGAKVTLRPDPVWCIIGGWSLGGSRILSIVEQIFLLRRNTLNQIIGWLKKWQTKTIDWNDSYMKQWIEVTLMVTINYSCMRKYCSKVSVNEIIKVIEKSFTWSNTSEYFLSKRLSCEMANLMSYSGYWGSSKQ